MRASEASTREVRLAKPSIRAAAKVMAEVAERDRFCRCHSAAARRKPQQAAGRHPFAGDIAAAAGPDPIGDAIRGVSKPGVPDCQSLHAGTGPPTLR